MKTRRPTLKSLALGAAVLLPILTAAVALAITAADAPPGPPAFADDVAADPISGGVFVYNSATVTGTVRFKTVSQPAPATIGYRLYVGTAARTAGSPYVLGNTPCDLGASTTANIQTCLVPPASIANASIHVAVTAYNQFGNEGDYSADGVFVPVTPPSSITVTPIGNNQHQMSLSWAAGMEPSHTLTITTEVFRRQGSTGAYTRIFTGTGTTFTDSGLARDTSYEYVFRSKVTGTNSPVSTYSAVTATQTKTGKIPADVFSKSVGNSPVTVTTLAADEEAVISGLSGQVRFAPAAVCSGQCVCTAGTGGISQGIWDDGSNQTLCYNGVYCNNDPNEGANHAALLVKVGNSAPQLASSGPFSGPGTLLLLVNDCNSGDNTGTFNATVTVRKS